MRFQGTLFNFTGFDEAWLGATSYPGYGLRVQRGDINRVIAHEAGHSLGLLHPFQLPGGEIRWLMDFIETPMSYYDEGEAYYRVGDVSPYESAKTALLHLAGIMRYLGLSSPPSSVEKWLLRGQPGKAFQEALQLVIGQDNRPVSATATITLTRAITMWRTITTETTLTKTITWRVTFTKTTSYPIQSTTTITKTVYRIHVKESLVMLIGLLIGLTLSYIALRVRIIR